MNFDAQALRAIAKHNPERLLDEPELDVASLQVWKAFTELHESRLKPRISILEIIAWLDLHELTDSEVRREYYDLIRMMDETWKDWADANSKPRDRRPENDGRS